MANFVLRLVANFMLRFLWVLRGLPAGALHWLGGDSANWARAFRNDYRIFVMCSSKENQTLGMKRVLTRSPFRLVRVEQLVRIMTASGWVLTDQVREFVESSGRRMQATQAVEGASNRQNQVGGANYSFRYKAPEKSFHTLLSRGVLQQAHDLHEVQPSRDLSTARARVPSDAFRPSRSKSSVDMWGIVGNVMPCWWSPSACNWHTQWVDLLKLRGLVGNNTLHLLDNLWLGGLVDASHPFVLRRKRAPSYWYFGLHHINGSCCLVYEAERRSVEGTSIVYLAPLMKQRELQTVAIVDLSEWEAQSFTWQFR